MLPAVALALKEVVSWLPLLLEKSANIILSLSLAELSSLLNNIRFFSSLIFSHFFFYIIFIYLVFVVLHFKFLFVNSLP